MEAQQDGQALPQCIIMIPLAAQRGALENTWSPSTWSEPCSSRRDAEAQAQAWHSPGVLVPPRVPSLPSRAARPSPGYGVPSPHGTVTGQPQGGLAAAVLHFTFLSSFRGKQQLKNEKWAFTQASTLAVHRAGKPKMAHTFSSVLPGFLLIPVL